MWAAHGDRHIYFTSLLTSVLGIGSAATACAHPPDLHYFCGRGAKDVIPLWRDAAGTQPNLPAGLLGVLARVLGRQASRLFRSRMDRPEARLP